MVIVGEVGTSLPEQAVVVSEQNMLEVWRGAKGSSLRWIKVAQTFGGWSLLWKRYAVAGCAQLHVFIVFRGDIH